MLPSEQIANDPQIEAMFAVGAHFGYSKTRRHPSIQPYIFGIKNGVEIIDLEKTKEMLERAVHFAHALAAEGRTLLFVGTKKEASVAIKNAANDLSLPYVSHRWIGGTLTNWNEIKKRILRLEELLEKREKGELSVYTKRERGEIDREIADLEVLFGGIAAVRSIPHALFVIDPREEETAVREAKRLRLPVIALAGTDCNINGIDYPIVGNDSARASIQFFVSAIAQAYREGRAQGLPPVLAPEEDSVVEEEAIIETPAIEEIVAAL